MPIPLVLAALVAAVLVAGCGLESGPAWPWWTARDSAAVRQAVAPWRSVLTPGPMLADTLRLDLTAGLSYEDSTSRTGDTLYKFAHVIQAWFEPFDSAHADLFQFGVTADTVAMRDTFCEVAYLDSMAGCRVHFEYDRLWVVGFRPDTIIDTTRVPPETTVVQRVSYTEQRAFPEPQSASKTYPWASLRKLFLSRTSDTSYAFRKLTGFRVVSPTAEEAPGVARVVLSRPGRLDTLFYAPRKDGRGLYNLRPVDSLYTLQPGEAVDIAVVASTPTDTAVTKNRFFLTVGGRRTDITANARLGQGTASFAEAGVQHFYLEVVPSTNLLYPGSAYSSAVWAVPVRVQE